MNTPKTDAILASQANGGFGLAKSQCIAQWYDHARQLETQVNELREALQRGMELCERGHGHEWADEAREIMEKTK